LLIVLFVFLNKLINLLRLSKRVFVLYCTLC